MSEIPFPYWTFIPLSTTTVTVASIQFSIVFGNFDSSTKKPGIFSSFSNVEKDSYFEKSKSIASRDFLIRSNSTKSLFSQALS